MQSKTERPASGIALTLWAMIGTQVAIAQSGAAWNVLDRHPTGTVEFPKSDPGVSEIWLYTDQMSYAPGDEVVFYVHTTAEAFSYTIERDGAETVTVKAESGVAGMMQETPEDAYSTGAGMRLSA